MHTLFCVSVIKNPLSPPKTDANRVSSLVDVRAYPKRRDPEPTCTCRITYPIFKSASFLSLKINTSRLLQSAVKTVSKSTTDKNQQTLEPSRTETWRESRIRAKTTFNYTQRTSENQPTENRQSERRGSKSKSERGVSRCGR